MNNFSNHSRQLEDIDDMITTLNRLLTLHGQDVWNYALFLTKNKELADDISQKVFIKIFPKYRNLPAQSSEKIWLLRITRNMILKHLKAAFFL